MNHIKDNHSGNRSPIPDAKRSNLMSQGSDVNQNNPTLQNFRASQRVSDAGVEGSPYKNQYIQPFAVSNYERPFSSGN